MVDPGDGDGAQPSRLRRLVGTIAAVLWAPVLPFAVILVGVYALILGAPVSLARIGGRLNKAATFRDGFLLLVALAYGVGYLATSDFYIVRPRADDKEMTYRVGSGTVLSTVGC